MSLSAILSEAFYFFRNHLLQLAALALPILLVQVGIQLWLGAEFAAMDPKAPQLVRRMYWRHYYCFWCFRC